MKGSRGIAVAAVCAVLSMLLTAPGWFHFAESAYFSGEGVPGSPIAQGLVALLWPGILAARYGFHHAWIVAAICLAALLFILTRTGRRLVTARAGGTGSLLMLFISTVVWGVYLLGGIALRQLPVPLPVTTRYDNRPLEKAIYIRAWTTAYRRGELGLCQTWCFRPEVETQGYYGGENAGLRTFRRLLGRDDSLGLTPLMWAVCNGDENEVSLLLEKGADVNARSASGRTALMFALSAGPGTVSMTRLLLENGADINAVTPFGYTPLMQASEEAGALRLLLHAGADVRARSNSGTTALMLTAAHGKPAMIDALLEAGSDLSAADDSGWTPLVYAAQWNNLETAAYLIDRGADVNHADRQGETVLAAARTSGYSDNEAIVELLLANGAADDARNGQ